MVAALAAEHGLWSAGSGFEAHALSYSVAHGIFPDQGSEPVSCIGRRMVIH